MAQIKILATLVTSDPDDVQYEISLRDLKDFVSDLEDIYQSDFDGVKIKAVAGSINAFKMAGQ